MKTESELREWIRSNTGLVIPELPVCAGHDAPWEYIWTSYHEPARDMVVWAPRGGGKTRLGALATLLDLMDKPGCAVRILGGSLEQSLRMWEHLLPDLEELEPGLFLGRPGLGKRFKLQNGSSAAVLTQSQRAVRGLRVQKLRCDEVELFDPQVWEAAQLVTRSIKPEKSIGITGAIEALSTHHVSHGLMHQILNRAQKDGTRIIRWCILDVLERCPMERQCGTCLLQKECQGRAKTQCDGFFRIDDAIAMKRRVSQEAWETEMLCRRPSRAGQVFPTFDPTIHVREQVQLDHDFEMSLAVDFGFHAPFVCLWIRDDGQVYHVVDEYLQPQRVVSEHVEQIEQRGWGKIRRLCCDPAGGARNDQTAESNVQYLRRQGYKVHTKSSAIVDGVEMIRSTLRSGTGETRLFIHPRCVKLIEAMGQYRYPDGGGELPLKDGVHDHPIDALRYFFVNRSTNSGLRGGRY